MAMILRGCGGCWFFFGSLQGFAIHQFITDVVNAPAMLSGAGGEAAVSLLLNSLPFGKVLSVIYFVLMLVFLASHLDAVAYTVAATSTRNLRRRPGPGAVTAFVLVPAAGRVATGDAVHQRLTQHLENSGDPDRHPVHFYPVRKNLGPVEMAA